MIGECDLDPLEVMFRSHLISDKTSQPTFSIISRLTVNEPHSVVDFLLFVCQCVFRLPSWLQRLVHGVDLLLRNTLESFLVWFLAWKLEQIFEGNRNRFDKSFWWGVGLYGYALNLPIIICELRMGLT